MTCPEMGFHFILRLFFVNTYYRQTQTTLPIAIGTARISQDDSEASQTPPFSRVARVGGEMSCPKIGLHKKRQMEKNVIPNQDNGVRLDF